MSAPARPTFVNRNANRRRAREQPEVGRERDHRAGPGGHAVHRGDDRERALAHALHDRPRHPREVQERALVGVAERADDLVHVAAGAEAPAGARDHHRSDVVAVRELGEQVAEVRVGVERERVQLLGPIERDGRDPVADLDTDVLPRLRETGGGPERGHVSRTRRSRDRSSGPADRRRPSAAAPAAPCTAASPYSRYRTSATCTTVSIPMRSMSASGPIGCRRPKKTAASMSSRVAKPSSNSRAASLRNGHSNRFTMNPA